jgi:hypothetical protein
VAGKYKASTGSDACTVVATPEARLPVVNEKGSSAKDDDVVTGMAKDVLISIITSAIIGTAAVIGAFFRQKIFALCDQNQNQQPNATP